MLSLTVEGLPLMKEGSVVSWADMELDLTTLMKLEKNDRGLLTPRMIFHQKSTVLWLGNRLFSARLMTKAGEETFVVHMGRKTRNPVEKVARVVTM